jgi:hypothetical protein
MKTRVQIAVLLAVVLSGCANTESASTTTAKRAIKPTVSKSHAEAVWRPYFREAANTGKSEAEATETTCDDPVGHGWHCMGVAVIPAEQVCWVEEAEVSKQGVRIKYSGNVELNPPGDPDGRCKLL